MIAAQRSSVAARRGAVSSVRPAARVVRPQAFFGAFGGNKAAEADLSEFYSFNVKDIDGKNFNMKSLRGKAVLVVNLASACGFTPQYDELQALYQKLGNKQFAILGFPCNQFGAQEPGNNQSIKQFAKSNYGVTFDLMSKVDVNGAEADPLFDWLKSQKGGFLGNDIKWNFSKFLVDADGNVVGRYGSTTSPAQIEADIRKAMA